MSFDDLINEVSKDVNAQVAKRGNLEADEVTTALQEVVKDFKEQRQLDVDERRGYYTDKSGNDYLVCNTDKEPIKNADGEIINGLFTTDYGWRLFAQHTAMYDADTKFMPKLTVFFNTEEKPKMALHVGMVLRGKMDLKYRIIPREDGDFGSPLKVFLKKQEVDRLEDLDSNTYERVFTFKAYQVLKVSKLK